MRRGVRLCRGTRMQKGGVCRLCTAVLRRLHLSPPPCSSNHIRICTCITLHSAAPDKPEKEITAEIQAIIRQVIGDGDDWR